MSEYKSFEDQLVNRETWQHRWGFADTRFVLNRDRSVELSGDRYPLCGYRMYDFIPYIESVLDVKLDFDKRRPEVEPKQVSPTRIDAGFVQSLESFLRSDQITTEDSVRLQHSHGQTTADEVFRVLFGHIDRVVDLVVFPESQDEAVAVVRQAAESGVCLVPFGGGTSVSSALKLPQADSRSMVAIDTRRMNQIEWIDRENLQACVQAGMTGLEMEAALAREGLTSGHEPDSMELSTVGGWIATNASGMKKNRYGNIEDIVENISMITPVGLVEQKLPISRASIGIQPLNLLFGSEGNLGLITRAVLKVHPLPEVKKYGSLVFPSFENGVDFLNELVYTAYVPASIRLVDNIQFRFGQALKPRAEGGKAFLDRLKKLYLLKLKGFDPDKLAAATIVMEGSRHEVEFQESSIYRLAKRFQGLRGGSENGRRGYMLTYAIAYIRDFLADFHIVGETFETSVPWNKIDEVCQAVRRRADELHRQHGLPGRCYVSHRVTQIYHSGVCVYFMFGFYVGGVEDPEEVFARIEHSLRETIIENGGSVSHHHGVGKIRKDFMRDTLSPASIEILKNLKRSSDPANIFGIRNNIFAEEE